MDPDCRDVPRALEPFAVIPFRATGMGRKR